MSLLGKILAAANFLAAAVFGFLVFLDFQKRQTWTWANEQRDTALQGLPLQEQYTNPRLPREVYRQQAPLPADAAELKKLFAAGAGQPVNAQVKAVEEIVASEGAGAFLAAVDQAAKQAVEKAKDNPAPLLKKLLEQLAATGQQRARYEEIFGKNLARLGKDKQAQLLDQVARRWMLAQALLPMEEIKPGGHREQLAYRIADLDRPFGQSDDYFKKLEEEYKNLEVVFSDRVTEAIRPQPPYPSQTPPGGLLLTLLAEKNPPHYLFLQRFPNEKKVSVRILDTASGKEAAGAFDPVVLKLTNVKGQPEITLTKQGNAFVATDDNLKEPHQVLAGQITLTPGGDQKKEQHFFLVEREPLEQRQAIAYVLFTLSMVRNPDGSLLGTPAEERAELIVGRQVFNQTVQLQMQILNQVADRRRLELSYDVRAFVNQYNLEVEDHIPYLIAAIGRTKLALEDLKRQVDVHDKQLQARVAHYREVVERLTKERQLTTEMQNELELWQKRLFAAQKAGAGVAEENQRLERLIRRLERQARQVEKGIGEILP